MTAMLLMQSNTVKDLEANLTEVKEVSEGKEILYENCITSAVREYEKSWAKECNSNGEDNECMLPQVTANKTEIEYSHRAIQCINQYK